MSDVKVCDAIMGSGKTEAAITYMNEHPGERFVYVSPYVDEDKRIKDACSGVNLYEPKQWRQYNGSKLLHTLDMLKHGLSVASTHQALRGYTNEMLDLIREKRYTLIIDENLEALQMADCHPQDFDLLLCSGFLEKDPLLPDCFIPTEKVGQYSGSAYRDLFRRISQRSIATIVGKNNVGVYYWVFPPEVLEAFDKVYILTYMFEGQGLSYCMRMHHIPYQKIGVCRDADGTYRFGTENLYVPDYVHNIHNLIHIADFGRCNEIGAARTALSHSWFENASKEDLAALRKNIYTYFRGHTDSSSKERMWSTFKSEKRSLCGGGYTKGFVSFNARANNCYRHKTALAYCINVYVHTGLKIFYRHNDMNVNEDAYALATMVQWIWRSAIRDGRPIDLYLPSRRMRDILCSWMDEL